ncbi:MAG: PQQ-dependent sugar dehydrogenase [Verrucomicrobia bacterium]|nr:PQQ-dependent sugar dehydrogenase [Verrucomicrobiota bacterium]
MHKRILILAIWQVATTMAIHADWRNDYEVAKGFRLDVDAQGFKFPTSIAVVPNPGDTPNSPLYFVTEIRGRVRVVTRNRSVYTFAENFFKLEPTAELPNEEGEIGMAGLCLEPVNGYVFVSYAYQDELGYYRNGLSRFQSDPQIFSIEPSSRVELLPVLKNFLSSVSHQIGPIAIDHDFLYLCIGDGEVASSARDLDSANGKILRMNLDGLPASGNPYAVDSDPNNIRNYIWASGLRNPFSIKLVGNKVFVNDNGPSADRFVQVQAGDDFLYDGSDESLSTNSLYLWRRSVSPVQMDYNPLLAKSLGFPDHWGESFMITLSGSPLSAPGKSDFGAKSIVALGVDVKNGKVSRPPSTLLNYRGKRKQMPVGLAYGPDGLFFLPLFPDSEGNSPVMRINYAPEKEHNHIINDRDLVPCTIYKFG